MSITYYKIESRAGLSLEDGVKLNCYRILCVEIIQVYCTLLHNTEIALFMIIEYQFRVALGQLDKCRCSIIEINEHSNGLFLVRALEIRLEN